MEILISTTDEQKNDMEMYANFCKRMSQRIGATSSFGILMWHLCIENRDLSAEYDDYAIRQVCFDISLSRFKSLINLSNLKGRILDSLLYSKKNYFHKL